MELKLDKQVRGTRLLVGETARRRRDILNSLIKNAEEKDCEEIFLPLLEPTDVYTDKAGEEILGQMYTFNDKGGRSLCLRPEGTATVQILASSTWKQRKDAKLWYETRCWRYERPQAGRYREFTQFGVEILNPKAYSIDYAIQLAENMIRNITTRYEINKSVKRGLAYYTTEGFEISCPKLGAQKQVCGGGTYKEGFGFAFGVDRLMLA